MTDEAVPATKKPRGRPFQKGSSGFGRPFPPGTSGNPGGKSKDRTVVIHMAREWTVEAIQTLAEVMTDAKGHPTARVAAANVLLERGWGKAPITMTDENGDTVTGPIVQVYLPCNGRDMKTIEHDDSDPATGRATDELPRIDG